MKKEFKRNMAQAKKETELLSAPSESRQEEVSGIYERMVNSEAPSFEEQSLYDGADEYRRES